MAPSRQRLGWLSLGIWAKANMSEERFLVPYGVDELRGAVPAALVISVLDEELAGGFEKRSAIKGSGCQPLRHLPQAVSAPPRSRWPAPTCKREQSTLKRSILTLSLILSASLLTTFTSVTTQVAEAAPPDSGAEGMISGIVKDSTTGDALEGALVMLECECLPDTREALSNAQGVYQFRDLPAGRYSIRVFVGEAEVTKNIDLPRQGKLRANFAVDPSNEKAIQIVVEASPVATSPSVSMTIEMDEAKRLPVGGNTSRDFTSVVDIMPTASRDAGEISLAGTIGAEPQEPRPSAGMLTAGTLDDNRTRELQAFASTVTGGPALARDVGLGLRADLTVVDTNGRSINDAELFVTALGSDSQDRAQLRTGTDGRAVINGVWDLGLATTSADQWARVVARKDGVETVVKVKLGAGPARIKLPLERSNADAQVLALDLVLVVDTTGSMTDELQWLVAELRSVVAQALADHPNVDARLGIVAYRDLNDEYVTRRFELSKRHAEFEAFLASETASGGGDYPEAVDLALTEAASFAWRHDQQAAKVILLVGDAPPHGDHMRETFAATSLLRAAGVSIYPVASSGVEDQAELVFRTIAADSGAQYLFLTDDSGIGKPHAKPHAEDYDVELLRSALLRILAAELRGEQAATPVQRDSAFSIGPGSRPTRAGFQLQRSLFDDGGAQELVGGPVLKVDLL